MTGSWTFYYRENRIGGGLFLLWRLVVTIAACIPVLCPALEESAGAADLSRFQRTALYVQSADYELRADFARATLQELGAVLLAEIDLAEGELVAKQDSGKLRGWAAAVEQYLRELALLRKDIEQGYDVQLSLAAGNELELWVGSRAIIATHPRPGHQALLEQAILGVFCSRNDCEAVTAAPPAVDAVPIPISRADVRPAWNFGPDGSVCEHRQLSVSFSDNHGLARYRLLCGQFLHEAVRLVDEIAWQRRHGVSVDWSDLAASSSPGLPEHVVRLNGAGDSVLVTIPVIHGTQGLLQMLVPWLRAQVEGGAPRHLVLEASRLGWETQSAGN